MLGSSIIFIDFHLVPMGNLSRCSMATVFSLQSTPEESEESVESEDSSEREEMQ